MLKNYIGFKIILNFFFRDFLAEGMLRECLGDACGKVEISSKLPED
jgi:hypothetical protein